MDKMRIARIRSRSTNTKGKQSLNHKKSKTLILSDKPIKLAERRSGIQAISDNFTSIINSKFEDSNLLARIKKVYDSYISRIESDISHREKEKQKALELLDHERDYHKKLSKRIKKIAHSNIHIKEDISNKQEQIDELLSSKQSTQSKLEEEIQDIESRFQKLSKKYHDAKDLSIHHRLVLKTLKAQGLPVEEIFCEINPRNNEKLWLELPSQALDF